MCNWAILVTMIMLWPQSARMLMHGICVKLLCTAHHRSAFQIEHAADRTGTSAHAIYIYIYSCPWVLFSVHSDASSPLAPGARRRAHAGHTSSME